MRTMLIVAAGGAAGATIRWTGHEAFEVGSRSVPWPTLAVNVLGCLLIGLAARRFPRDSDAWRGLAVGGLGGLTTFSTFALQTTNLLERDATAVAAIYVALTLLAGFGATELALGGDDPA